MATYNRPVLGSDLSVHQAGIRGRDLAAAGIRYAWIKLTEGVGYADPEWRNHRAQLEAFTIPWGPYHFPTISAGDATAEATWFLDVLGDARHQLPPILDVERSQLSRDATINWAVTWATHVERALNRPVGIYWGCFYLSPPGFHAAANDPRLARRLWWMPYYLAGRPRDPDPTGQQIGWGHSLNGPRVPEVWQYTDNGRIAGYSGALDLNITDQATLDRLLGQPTREDDMPLPKAFHCPTTIDAHGNEVPRVGADAQWREHIDGIGRRCRIFLSAEDRANDIASNQLDPEPVSLRGAAADAWLATRTPIHAEASLHDWLIGLGWSIAGAQLKILAEVTDDDLDPEQIAAQISEALLPTFTDVANAALSEVLAAHDIPREIADTVLAEAARRLAELGTPE